MKTILVVDDDDGVRVLLRRMLESLGYHVVDASNAEAALDVLAKGPIDLVLVDVLMPGRDGIWLTDQILGRHPGVAVALATGLVEMDPSVTLRPGVVGYIVKPFRRSAMSALLSVAFQRPSPPRTDHLDLAALDIP